MGLLCKTHDSKEAFTKYSTSKYHLFLYHCCSSTALQLYDDTRQQTHRKRAPQTMTGSLLLLVELACFGEREGDGDWNSCDLNHEKIISTRKKTFGRGAGEKTASEHQNFSGTTSPYAAATVCLIQSRLVLLPVRRPPPPKKKGSRMCIKTGVPKIKRLYLLQLDIKGSCVSIKTGVPNTKRFYLLQQPNKRVPAYV